MSAAWLLDELLSRRDRPIRVAVVGAGVMGKAICRAIDATPGMTVSMVVSRSETRGREASTTAQITADPGAPGRSENVDVVVDATGDVSVGVVTALAAIHGGKTTLSFSAETDALVGPYLSLLAQHAGTVYGFADGDQPGVLLRLYDDCRLQGFDVRALFNCKGFLDKTANPESPNLAAYRAHACNTRIPMLVSFTDGTKINLEQTVVANATGFLPLHQGMQGFQTTLSEAAKDVGRLGPCFVDYTLGGDFGGGVFALIHDKNADDGALLKYFKVGREGPWRILYRPYHLCNFEVPRAIAEAFFLRKATATPKGLFARTVAVAKRALMAGDILDGIGGHTVYGQIVSESLGKTFLPIGLAAGGRVLRDFAVGETLSLDSVAVPPNRVWEIFVAQQAALAG